MIPAQSSYFEKLARTELCMYSLRVQKITKRVHKHGRFLFLALYGDTVPNIFIIRYGL